MIKRQWTEIEDMVLKDQYPIRQARFIAGDLGRTAPAIHCRARALGLEGRRGGSPLPCDISRLKAVSLTDWAYIAGFFDGEGSVWISDLERPNRQKRQFIMISIAQNETGVLYWIRNTLGIGNVCLENGRASKFRAMGYIQTYAMLTGMMPFLQVKKDAAKKAIGWLASYYSDYIREFDQCWKD